MPPFLYFISLGVNIGYSVRNWLPVKQKRLLFVHHCSTLMSASISPLLAGYQCITSYCALGSGNFSGFPFGESSWGFLCRLPFTAGAVQLQRLLSYPEGWTCGIIIRFYFVILIYWIYKSKSMSNCFAISPKALANMQWYSRLLISWCVRFMRCQSSSH